jgi:hypothetical protein
VHLVQTVGREVIDTSQQCRAFKLFNNAMFICADINWFTDAEKLCFILSNSNIVQISAKTCWLILERKRRFAQCPIVQFSFSGSRKTA